MPTRKPKSTPPFEFVLDELAPLNPRVNPMFGSFGIYVYDKIVFALRSRDTHTDSNGIWIATSAEHHASLKKEFPMMCSVPVLTVPGRETGWQMIPAGDDNFETAAINLCRLVRQGDARIGNIPKAKKKKIQKP